MSRMRAGVMALVFLLAFVGAAYAQSAGTLLDTGRFNDFAGALDGLYKIRMLLFPKDNTITGSYFYEAYETKIALTGVYDGNAITLYEYDDAGEVAGTFRGTVAGDRCVFTGVWRGKDGSEYAFATRLTGTFPGLPENIYIEAGGRSTEEVERFARELKDDILAGNKEQVAAKISYPLKVYVDGQRMTVGTAEEFVALYDEIFYPDYFRAVAKCFPLNMHSDYRGIMFGDKGQVWLNYVYTERPSDAKLQVTALNNNPARMEYFLRD